MFSNPSASPELSAIEEFGEDVRPAAMVFGTITEDLKTTGAIIVVAKIGDAFGVLTFITNENEVDDNIALAKAMAAKLEFVMD